ncbi:hypothetical protein LDENG_00054910 [Lucifuga dentata]|nr:hypothetical protein LDENG_00054910 [Lucifuga dentata]
MLDVPDRLKGEVLHSVSQCAPGPHAFLLVIPISKAFRNKDLDSVLVLLMQFGERIWRRCMVLFTWVDWLGDRSIEEHIASEGRALQWLVEKCGDRYHVLNCHHFDYFEGIELYQKIVDMVTRNKGCHFTTSDKKTEEATLTEERTRAHRQDAEGFNSRV